MASEKFVSSGTLLFISHLVIAGGGGFFWLMIGTLDSASAIGQSTSIYSLAIVTVTITMLGFEFTLLKKAYNQRSQILGTTLIIELGIVLASLPLIFYIINEQYAEPLQEFTWIVIGIVMSTFLYLVFRHALLGISDVKSVLIIEVVGTAIKLVLGYVLISSGFGVLGILLTFLLTTVIMIILASYRAARTFKFSVGNIVYVKEILRHGLANAPSKLSRTIIINLSIVLLVLFSITDSDIGIFFIVLMISVMASSFATTIAFMVIPSSTISNIDLSTSGLRIGLSFTVPVIIILIVEPESILSIIGTEYMAGGIALQILAIGILPYIVLTNSISKFNNTNELKKLVIIGVIQIITFLAAFTFLVPSYGFIGASFSILISFIFSCIPCIIWLDRSSIKYMVNASTSIFLGWIVGYSLSTLTQLHPILTILPAIGVSVILLLVLKNISYTDIKQIIKTFQK